MTPPVENHCVRASHNFQSELNIARLQSSTVQTDSEEEKSSSDCGDDKNKGSVLFFFNNHRFKVQSGFLGNPTIFVTYTEQIQT